MLYMCDMFPYTDKENEWLSGAKTTKSKTRKSNLNRQRQVTEEPELTEWTKVGHYWFVPYNRFKI